MAETDVGKNLASPAAGGSALPFDPYTPFLEHDASIRVQATQALAGTDPHSIKETDKPLFGVSMLKAFPELAGPAAAAAPAQ